MSLSEVKQRLDTLKATQISQTEALLNKLSQEQELISPTDELTRESLDYRIQKLEREE